MKDYIPPLGTALKDLDTPALILDLDVMEANLRNMMAFFNSVPANLRPHCKTVKSPDLAKKMLEAGAQGICCAKLGEAEVMVDAGIHDILITSQLVGPTKMQRLGDLLQRAPGVKVVVDSEETIGQLSQMAQSRGLEVGTLLEVDTGMSRCGTPMGQPSVDMAQRIARAKGLRFLGLQGYEGHLQHLHDLEEKRQRCLDVMKRLTETADLIRKSGLEVQIVSTAGTGTAKIAGAYPGVTEVQAGSFLVTDTAYKAAGAEFDFALTVLSTVISRPNPQVAIIDAGLKTLSTDMGMAQVKGYDAEYYRPSEEHGRLKLSDPAINWKVGDKIELIPSHCCTTINLHDHYCAVRKGKLEAVWPISARGKIL